MKELNINNLLFQNKIVQFKQIIDKTLIFYMANVYLCYELFILIYEQLNFNRSYQLIKMLLFDFYFQSYFNKMKNCEKNSFISCHKFKSRRFKMSIFYI